MRGKRASMEDFQDARVEKVGEKIIGLFGVFDGACVTGDSLSFA